MLDVDEDDEDELCGEVEHAALDDDGHRGARDARRALQNLAGGPEAEVRRAPDLVDDEAGRHYVRTERKSIARSGQGDDRLRWNGGTWAEFEDEMRDFGDTNW